MGAALSPSSLSQAMQCIGITTQGFHRGALQTTQTAMVTWVHEVETSCSMTRSPSAPASRSSSIQSIGCSLA